MKKLLLIGLLSTLFLFTSCNNDPTDPGTETSGECSCTVTYSLIPGIGIPYSFKIDNYTGRCSDLTPASDIVNTTLKPLLGSTLGDQYEAILNNATLSCK